MKIDAKIYYFYKSITSEVLRIAVFLLLLGLSILGSLIHLYPNLFITLFLLFLIFEIYFSQKIAKRVPRQTIAENKGNVFASFTLEAYSLWIESKDTTALFKNLLELPQVDFVLGKIGAQYEAIDVQNLDKEKLSQAAYDFAKSINGKYVTTLDLFSAYILTCEQSTKFLFNYRINLNDFQEIVNLATSAFPYEENKNTRISGFSGEGIAESWVYGWSLEAQKYMVDLTSEFLSSQTFPVVRRNEYNLLLESLGKGKSAMLIGNGGSGKESLVKHLVGDSYGGLLLGNLYHQKICQLMVDAFMAGAQTQGEIEERLNLLMTELTHSGNVIMYIPEFENLLGNMSFNLDLSGALIPYIKNGNVRIIATVAPENFKTFVASKPTLSQLFTEINFVQMTEQEVLELLLLKSLDIEQRENVVITYRAIVASVNFGQKYAKEKVNPGAAVTLLEDSASAAKLAGNFDVLEEDVLNQVTKVTHVSVGEPKQIEKDLLLNLESEFHKRIIDQTEAVSAISEALRRLREGLAQTNKPISFLFLGPTGVGKTETAKALADIYYGSKERFLRFDMSEFVGEDGIKKLLGTEDSNGLLTEAIYDSPYSLVLLDEFEKADEKVLDLFLQILEEGRLTDAKGKTVSFTNSIIIATSNAASEYIRENVEKGSADKTFKQNLLEFVQSKNIFKPELLNRFDDIVVFKPLGQQEILEITKLLLMQVSKTLSQKDIRVSFDQSVLLKISSEGYDKEFGARPLRRYIADNIEDLIARKMLKDEIKRGDSIIISTDPKGDIVISK